MESEPLGTEIHANITWHLFIEMANRFTDQLGCKRGEGEVCLQDINVLLKLVGLATLLASNSLTQSQSTPYQSIGDYINEKFKSLRTNE